MIAFLPPSPDTSVVPWKSWVMDALQHLKGLEALKKMNPETEEDKKKRRRGIIFGAVINFIVSLAMIIVGGIHNNDTDCPGRQATEFLIVGGSILLCSSLLKLQYLAPLPMLHKVVDIGSPLLDFVYFIIVIWGSARVFGKFTYGKNYSPLLGGSNFGFPASNRFLPFLDII